VNSIASEVIRRDVLSRAPRTSPPWYRRLLPFVGPGYVVAVGYMDPGNWATALAAGSGFGYALLSVVLLSSLMAMLLQAAAVRLGLASGMDLAQACRQHFGPRANVLLWLACEIAIIACNLAEVLGMACGLQLLFRIPLGVGVCLTALDVLLILGLQSKGVRRLEAFIISLTAIIAGSFAIELWWLHPPLTAVAAGFAPTPSILTNPDMLYLAVGIIGATVMPHNLYLHSSIVQTHSFTTRERLTSQSIRYATVDSNIALGLALLVNAGILVLASGAFHRPGGHAISSIADAYQLLSPVLGVGAASAVFGIGLIASGLSSSITGTLAGQIVMEGFLALRVSRGARAALTRGLALLPAAGAVYWLGNAGVGKLLILSQVVLGLQLPFAVIPLLWFTTRRKYLGPYAFGPMGSTLLWATAALVVAVNLWVLMKLAV
jgi:manganese transport protein